MVQFAERKRPKQLDPSSNWSLAILRKLAMFTAIA